MWIFSLQIAFTLMLTLAVCLKILEFYRRIRHPQLRLFPFYRFRRLLFQYELWKLKWALDEGEIEKQTEYFLQGSADHKYFDDPYGIKRYQDLYEDYESLKLGHDQFKHRKQMELDEMEGRAQVAEATAKRMSKIVQQVERDLNLTEDQKSRLAFIKAETTQGIVLGVKDNVNVPADYIEIVNQKPYLRLLP